VQNLDSFNILTATAGTIEFDTGDATGVVDLSAFVGQTVRLSFDFFVPQNFTGPAFFQLDNVRIVGRKVDIDIMPSDPGNNLNLRAGSGAGISVAILSVGGFFEAPNLIDPLTLEFGPGQASISGRPRTRDVDGDGNEDLVVKFLTDETGIACGDTHAILSGRTFDFEPILGSDAINTFNCPRTRKRW
jgi:hypothetical protein